MRKACLNLILELARTDDRVFFIGSDLGVGTLNQFKKEFPDRFFMEGISEANVIGMAAGLALEGKIVYVNTIATFLTRRCFEQVALDLCLHNLPVRLIGNGGGLVYAPLGPTHEAIEDIAIFRSLPNMTIVAPADAEEMKRLMPLTLSVPGPIYIRLAKGFDPIVTNKEDTFAIGKVFKMRDGTDCLIISTGVMLNTALKSANLLSDKGIESSVIHVPTIKPLDTTALLKSVEATKSVVTLEEHSVIGGLGSAVAEIIAESNMKSPPKFRRIGLPDCFPNRYGSQADLFNYFGLTPEAVTTVVRSLTLL